ncbi:CaiB/BaiF CoA-transferase family protein [Ferrovibrio sp.]|uniref:CaiB/BaiF CoA transferase family protein n=1 Tax=Ferrovibrio sp. TaxID=1917215 RepID=UPI0025BE595E|nr:CaiB/BaiF CoA-transferase family protein [Ferrovibrio sp.]
MSEASTAATPATQDHASPKPQSPPRPLAGLRVLDFGHTVMGPCAGLLLADLGADVIKIEPPEGCPTRKLPGFASGFFATYARNKRSLALDLKKPDARAVLHKLAAGADVVLENYGPGTIERLGCGWEDLRAVNPRLIYLAMKGYLAGPYEQRGALDEVVQMQSGLAYMTGPPGQPLRAGAPVIDMMGGVFGVVAVLAALRERDQTGQGQRVAASLYESAAFLMAPFAVGSAMIGEPMPPMPARKNAWGIYDVFTAADGGMVFLGVTSDAHWRRFCAAFGCNDLVEDARLQGNAARSEARDWMLPIVRERVQALSVAEISERAEAANIPWARVGHPADLAHDPQLLAHGGLIDTAVSPLGGGEGMQVAVPGLPLEFGDQRIRTRLQRQPPAIGEHSVDVLREAGFSAADIAALQAKGIVLA